MKSSPDISVIIPIYNVEKYLEECLDSVVANLSCELDIEVILVNDGSTDKSADIANKYIDKYSNFVMYCKSNGGLSDARNYGVKKARGNYIFFLDSDDWILEDTLVRLFSFSKRNNCDMVQCGNIYVYPKSSVSSLEYWPKNCFEMVLNTEEAMSKLIENDILKNFAWGKLYKREIVDGIDFPLGKYFEDSYWQHQVIHKAKRIGLTASPFYFYRQRKSSISGRFSIKNIDLLKGFESRIDFLEKHYPELRKKQIAYLTFTLTTQYCLSRFSFKFRIRKTFGDLWIYYHYLYGEDLRNYGNNLRSYIIVKKHPILYPLISLYYKMFYKLNLGQ